MKQNFLENEILQNKFFGEEKVFSEKRKIFMGFETNAEEVFGSQIDDNESNDQNIKDLKLSKFNENTTLFEKGGENKVKLEDLNDIFGGDDKAEGLMKDVQKDYQKVILAKLKENGFGINKTNNKIDKIWSKYTNAGNTKLNTFLTNINKLNSTNETYFKDTFSKYISLIKKFDKDLKDTKVVENASTNNNSKETIKETKVLKAFAIDGVNTEVKDGKFYIYSKDRKHGKYFTIPKGGEHSENDKYLNKDGSFNKNKIKEWAKLKVTEWKKVEKKQEKVKKTTKTLEKKDTFKSIQKDYLQNIQDLFTNLKEKKDSNNYDKGEIKEVSDSLTKIQLKIIRSKTIEDVQNNSEDYLLLANKIDNLPKKNVAVKNASKNDNSSETKSDLTVLKNGKIDGETASYIDNNKVEHGPYDVYLKEISSGENEGKYILSIDDRLNDTEIVLDKKPNKQQLGKILEDYKGNKVSETGYKFGDNGKVENASKEGSSKEINLKNLDSLENKINKIIKNIDEFDSSSREEHGENVIGKIGGHDVILYQRQIADREAILKGDYTKFDTQYVVELDGDDKGFFGSDTEVVVSKNKKPDFDKVKTAIGNLDKKSKEK